MNFFRQKLAVHFLALLACMANFAAADTLPKVDTTAEAQVAIGSLGQKTVGDYFPAEQQQRKGSRALNQKEVTNFDSALKVQITALQKIGFLDADKFNQCWAVQKPSYINPASLREMKDVTTGALIAAAWMDCLKKDPDPKHIDDWIANLVKSDGVAVAAGAAGTASLWILAQVGTTLKQIATLTLIGDLVRAYAEPFMGHVRESVGLMGKRQLGDVSVKVAGYFASRHALQKKNIDRLSNAQSMLSDAEKLADGLTIPGLSPAQQEENYQKLNRLFLHAVNVWGSTLTPNSQSGRSILMEGVINRQRDYTSHLATFETKMELYRQGIAADLPKAYHEREQAIAALKQNADDQIHLAQATNNSDKIRAIQKIITDRDAAIRTLNEEKKSIKTSLDLFLEANAKKKELSHDLIQDSNIYLRRCEEKLAKLGVSANASEEFMKAIKQARDQAIHNGSVDEDIIRDSRRHLATLRLNENALDEILTEELAHRKLALINLSAIDETIANEAKKLHDLKVPSTLVDDLLNRQSDMLLARQQLDATLAAQMLHDQMYPEFNRMAQKNVADASAVMRKEYGFNDYETKLRERMRKIILEMGFEIGPNEDPKLDIVDVIKNLQSKMEEDKQGLIKEANGINAEAMRDWLKFKLGLPSKMAEEASTIVGSAGNSCEGFFRRIPFLSRKK